ncbi:MAG: diphthine--ammonia ligase [Deltaproteobacteria bacterium]|nr:diphthine--ammonia ligase [Deltaproteobacteria bacterium]
MTETVIFSWSGGKDSALALHEIQQNQNYTVFALLTTITKDFDRISMHGVRRVLLQRQAESIGLPLYEVLIPKNGSNDEYDSIMKEEMIRFREKGISAVVFGDIFLEDVRKYREGNLSAINMKAVFPLWMRNTADLAKNFIDRGFKAVVTCVDSHVLDEEFAGKVIDLRFLSGLHPDVDPCGENGEFHSFVFDGPLFKQPVKFKKGEVILRDNRFYYCDLRPAD